MGSIVSSIVGGIIGGNAAGAAGNVIAGTDNTVAQRVQDAITQGRTDIQSGLGAATGDLSTGLSQYDTATSNALNRANPLLADFYNSGMNMLQPYLSGGQAAFQQLSNLTAPGSSFMKPFDASMMASQDPGYQFRLQQGLKQMQAASSATGGLGGAALRSANEFGQGLASSEYNNAFNRYMQNRQQTFGMLNALAGYGQNATNEALNLGQTTAGRMAGNIMNVGMGQGGAALSTAGQKAGMEYGTGNTLAQMGLQGQMDVGGWLDKGAQATAAGILGQAAAKGQMWGGIGQGINAAIMGGLGAGGYLPGVSSGMGGFWTGMGQGLGMIPWQQQSSGTLPPFDPTAPGSMGGYYPRVLTPDQLGAIAGGGAGSVDVSGGAIPMPSDSTWGSIFPDIPQIQYQPVG